MIIVNYIKKRKGSAQKRTCRAVAIIKKNCEKR